MRPDLAVASLSLVLVTAASAPPKPPSIEGTYRLVSRDMRNGTKQVPPTVDGLMSFSKGYRNFNIYVRYSAGKVLSLSYVASYQLTPTEYHEKSIFFLLNDESSGKGATYDLSGRSGAAPVTLTGARVAFTFPLHDEPAVVFEGTRMTATENGPYGSFVDHWERVP